MTRQQELIDARLCAALDAAATNYRQVRHNLHANADTVAAFDKATRDYSEFLRKVYPG